MKQTERFAWHTAARLFAAGKAVRRPAGHPPGPFCTIPADPPFCALEALTRHIQNGSSFAVTNTPLAHNPGEVPDRSLVTFTGGSTGAPKALLRSQASWIASFKTNARLFELGPGDNVAVLGSLAHSLGLYAVLEGLHLGLDVHLLGEARPRAQGAQIANQSASVIYGTPTQLRQLARAGRTLPAVRLILCGGGAFDPVTQDAVSALAPAADVHEFYGAAETSFVAISDPDTPPGAVGRAYPEVELKILDAEGVPTTGQGEVWVRSPYLFERYLGAPEIERREGFVSVGELGQIDDEGYLWLSGRKNRQISIADQTVCPETIERFITGLPGAPDAAILPRPDPVRGLHLIAALETSPDTTQAETVLSACRAEFGPLFAPKRVVFKVPFPRLTSGKTDLVRLARMLEQTA